MSEWLSRDPKMTGDQNKVARLLVGKALKEGGVESGRDSQASPPWHHLQPGGMALCSVAAKCSCLRRQEEPKPLWK